MKIIDLTGPLENGMWSYGKPFTPYRMKRLSTMAEDGYIASEIVLTTHTGTHIDCPRHFGEERAAIDSIPLETYYGDAVLLDISGKSVSGSTITKTMLLDAGADKIASGDICVVNTGWYKRWNDNDYEENYPKFTPDSVSLLTDRGVKLLATDIPIIGDPESTDTDMVLCEKGIPSIYALTNLGELPEKFKFAAFPLRIKDGDGSPVRAVAIMEDEE